MKKLLFLLFLAVPAMAQEMLPYPITNPNDFQEQLILMYEYDAWKVKSNVENGNASKEEVNRQITAALNDLKVCASFRYGFVAILEYTNQQGMTATTEEELEVLRNLSNMDASHLLYLGTALENIFGSDIITKEWVWEDYQTHRHQGISEIVDLFNKAGEGDADATQSIQTITQGCATIEANLRIKDRVANDKVAEQSMEELAEQFGITNESTD